MLEGTHELCLYFPHVWPYFGISDLHIMLLSLYKFGENFHREGYTFLMGMSEIRFMCVLENLMFLK